MPDVLATTASLATSAGLAARWELSRQRVDQLAGLSGFPAPVRIETGGRPMKVYDVTACEQWREENRR